MLNSSQHIKLQGKVRYTYSITGTLNSEHINLQDLQQHRYVEQWTHKPTRQSVLYLQQLRYVTRLLTTLDNSLCLWPITRIPIITFPAYADTKLHCLVTEAPVCEELNQSCIQSAAAGVNPEICWLQVHMLTTTPPSHSDRVCLSLKHSRTSLPTTFSFFRPVSQTTLSLYIICFPVS